MPYRQLNDLPDSVQDVLPNHAQEIYQEAFNNAWNTYARPSDRKGNDDRETVAHKVAWSAVKHSYTKSNRGDWVRKH
ncbi:ChaB family protein [Gilvimarinus sp. 1_MG-2023]|uniref:ChaB family protein n=1 Tax=Gilvimarinus sp. 1_MG-2023 TaxID=3062638 RepID=UPI0026E1F2A9|nr:ChaB family protein [Gilvimarinus sp. 1_MG-2023]MDO6746219.1 ChaB family protein [Gilvimarinus sp. 1_MG-2023]